jgi:molybdopterin-guanine dinucleotide biosynthesis protein
MIVEFFGPPGSGKTTLATALTRRLRERRCPVELTLSYRPAETTPSDARAAGRSRSLSASAVRRVARAATEMVAMTTELFGDSREARTAGDLIRLLPPKDIFWSLRLRQYLLRLSRTWQRCSARSDLALFDQAYVQALCSLAYLARVSDRDRIGRALDAAPQPDLLVRLETPRTLLEDRLCERTRRQGRLEQMLEFDLEANLQTARLVDRLQELLRERGRPVISVASTDEASLRDAVDAIEAKLMPMLRSRDAARGTPRRSAPSHARHATPQL